MKIKGVFLGFAIIILSVLMALPIIGIAYTLSMPPHSYAYDEKYDLLAHSVRGYLHSSEEVRVVIIGGRLDGTLYDETGCDHDIICDTWGGWLGVYVFNNNGDRATVKYNISVDGREFYLKVQY